MADIPEETPAPHGPRRPDRYRAIPARFKKSQLGAIQKSFLTVLQEWIKEGLDCELTLDTEDPAESDREGAYKQHGTLRLGSCNYNITLHSYGLIPDAQRAKTLAGIPYRRSNLIIALEEQHINSEGEVAGNGVVFEIYAKHDGKRLCIDDTHEWDVVLDTHQDDQAPIGIEQFLYEHIISPDRPNIRQRISPSHAPAPAYPKKPFVPRVVT